MTAACLRITRAIAWSARCESKRFRPVGWGFGHFNTDGSIGNETLLKTCFPCHAKASRDFVFTRYAP